MALLLTRMTEIIFRHLHIIKTKKETYQYEKTMDLRRYRPAHLAAIAPWEGFCDHYRESGTRGGIPTPEFPEMIAETLASDMEFLKTSPE